MCLVRKWVCFCCNCAHHLQKVIAEYKAAKDDFEDFDMKYQLVT